MEIKGSVQEFKELMKNFQLKEEKNTPAAGTTDVILFDNKPLVKRLESHV